MKNRIKQYQNLQKASKERHDATTQLMRRVLEYISQTHRPPPITCYTPKFILSVARHLQPGTTLHRSTLTSNLTVAHMIEQARIVALTHTLPTPATRRSVLKPKYLPDFTEIMTWRRPKRQSPDWEKHRRATLSTYTKQDLAEYIVRLTNTREHTEMRLAQIELAEWVSGSWPDHLQYPLEPMRYDPTDDAHFASLLTRPTLKLDLINMCIALETATRGPHERLEEYDIRYFKSIRKTPSANVKPSGCRARKNTS